MKKEKGITLIALIITIIVLIILAGISIAMLTGESGLITRANESKFKTQIAEMKEELELFKTDKLANSNGEFNEETLSAGKDRLFYNTQKEEEKGNIITVLPTLEKNTNLNIEIIKGKIILSTQDKNEMKWAQEFGIEVNPYKVENGVLLSANENLLLVDNEGNITIPQNVTEIGSGAFANVKGIKKIIIPGSVKKIGYEAFALNSEVEEVIIEEGVETISSRAFRDCANLKKVTMGNSITSIGGMAFYGDRNLEELKLSNQIQSLESYVLSLCHKLEILEIPENIKEIKEYAISNCSGLKTVIISKNVQFIDTTTFSETNNLTNVVIDKENQYYTVENGIMMNKAKTQICLFLKTALINKELEIPSTVSSLNLDLLKHLGEITKLSIPKSVTQIALGPSYKNIETIEIAEENPNYSSTEKAIFNKDKTELIYYYRNENKIEIPEGVKVLKNYSLINKPNLTELILPNTLQSILSQVISGNSQLTKLKLGENITYIDGMAFYNTNITDISMSENNPNYTIENNLLYNKDKTRLLHIFIPIDKLVTFEVPEGVKIIDNYVFHGCNYLKSVKIASTVKEIGFSFSQCGNIERIEIPSNVEKINGSCFERCNSLKEIIIDKEPNSISYAPWQVPIGMRAIIWKK